MAVAISVMGLAGAGVAKSVGRIRADAVDVFEDNFQTVAPKITRIDRARKAIRYVRYLLDRLDLAAFLVFDIELPSRDIDRRWSFSNSGDAMPSLRYMRLQALLPLIIHKDDPHSALVIGFGTGITAGALLQYSGLNQRVCAELLPTVVSAGPFFHGNFGAFSDSKLKVRLSDGRRELLRNAQRYDLITLEPPPPSAVGVVNLYSRDFYHLAASRLQPNDLFAQWLPIATQNDDDTRSLVRSFLDVFPYATVWTTELHEMLLIGSLSPIELNLDRISQRFNQTAISDALKEVGISSSAALLATWVMGREGLDHYAGTALPVTDDRPRIEYSSWPRQDEITRVLPELLALRSEAACN